MDSSVDMDKTDYAKLSLALVCAAYSLFIKLRAVDPALLTQDVKDLREGYPKPVDMLMAWTGGTQADCHFIETRAKFEQLVSTMFGRTELRPKGLDILKESDLDMKQLLVDLIAGERHITERVQAQVVEGQLESQTPAANGKSKAGPRL